MRNSIRDLLEQQNGVIAVWQLRAAGVERGPIRHAMRGMRQVHHGVFLSGHAPPTSAQLWMAATLTAPDTALSHRSRGRAGGFFDDRGSPGFETVTRRGSGG